MRVRVGKALLYGTGLTLGSGLGYSLYQSEGDPNNVGAVRFGRAALAVGKIGVDYKRTLYNRDVIEKDVYEKALCECHLRSAQELLKLCCDNGGVFIKVGQHIGALDYLLPDEYVETMKVLHSRAPEMPLDDIYSVLNEELGKDPTHLFASFDPEPLGTASLAQVHKAVLHNGEVVAVKVQHKYVKKHSFVDIWTCDLLVRMVKTAFPQFSFMWLAEEMRINLPLELAFTQEAKNSEKVAKIFKDYTWLKVPKIVWRFTTDRVLVMEYCAGAHINDVTALKKDGIDVFEVSRKIGQMYSKMIFDDGYVHCDPHPGNVLVSKNKAGEAEVVLLDHGLYIQLSNKFRYDYADFWSGIINRDVAAIKVAADSLGVGALSELFACMVTARSWSSIQKGVDVAERSAAESAEIKANLIIYLKEISDVLAFVNRQMILIFKTNDLLRGIESNLGTKNSMSSFIQMSRSCLRVIQEKQLLEASSSFSRWRINLGSRWAQFRISCYEVFLYIYWSRLGQVLKLRR
jgi:aarF domain-containing kinase